MKTTMLSVIGCALLAAGVLPARAQTTNITLNVNIALTGVAPSNSGAAHIKIGTKDVINAIAAATSTNFSSRARLVAVFASGSDVPTFIVRDAGTDTAVSTDVLSMERGRSVDATKTSATGVVSGQIVSIDTFHLATDTLSFDVQGYSTESASNRGSRGTLDFTSPVSLNSKVNGTANADAVVQGVISSSGRKAEPVP